MDDFKIKLRLYQYYILITLISLICLFVLPFLGSAADIQLNIPNNTAGWIVWSITNLSTSILALLIFHCFIKQAKVNVKDDKYFLMAEEILRKSEDKEHAPRSPEKFLRGEYGRKGIFLAIGSFAAMVGLGNAILTFNLVVMLSFITVVVNSIVCGIIEMNKVEEFWTSEYYQYAIQVKEKKEAEEHDREERTDLSELTAASSEE